jgi:hydroxypyruvate isomerase
VLNAWRNNYQYICAAKVIRKRGFESGGTEIIMRLCVAIPCFFGGKDFCECIRTVKSLGYDAVETYSWRSLDLDAVRRTMDETGVELISICTTEFNLTDPAFREKWIAGIRESCVAAKKLGANRLITQVGMDTGRPRKEQHTSIVEGLRAGAPILEENGITCMIEPLNTLVNHPGYYLTSSNEAFDIVREVGSPNVKVIFDIYHQQVMEGNIIPNVVNNLDCIAHLHGAGHPGRNELQFGENDYRVIMSAINNAGYTGALGLEYKPLLDPIESLIEAKKIYG